MRKRFAASAIGGILTLTLALASCDVTRPPARAAEAEVTADGSALVPIEIKLPRPGPVPTLPDGKLGIDVSRVKEIDDKKPWPPFMAPAGARNIALGKPVTASDEEPIIGDPEQVTDGEKEAGDGYYVELGPGTQHVTVDLGGEHEIFAILVWHGHCDSRIYHDVVVQVADDPDFITGVRAIFNSDHDNSSGLGLGGDYEYLESRKGLLVDAKAVKTRYIRLYSNGSTVSEMNRYAEVEIYGLPVR